MTFDDKRHVGVLAQDVQAVLPEAVSSPEDEGYLSVSYSSLIPLLIEAVKALDQQRMELEAAARERERERDATHCASLLLEMDELVRQIDLRTKENQQLMEMLSNLTSSQ